MYYEEIKRLISEDNEIDDKIVYAVDNRGASFRDVPAQIRVTVWKNFEDVWEITIVSKDVLGYQKVKNYFDTNNLKFKYVGGGAKLMYLTCLNAEDGVIEELQKILRFMCKVHKGLQ